MTLDQITNLAEIIAAVATVATLLFLSIEIRRNNRLLRAESRRSVLNMASQLSIAIGQSSETSKLFSRGLMDYSELSPEEKTQFQFLFSVLSSHADLAYTDWQLGLTDANSFETSARDYFNLLKTKGGRAYWRHRGANHAEGFRHYIEREVFQEQASRGPD